MRHVKKIPEGAKDAFAVWTIAWQLVHVQDSGLVVNPVVIVSAGQEQCMIMYAD